MRKVTYCMYITLEIVKIRKLLLHRTAGQWWARRSYAGELSCRCHHNHTSPPCVVRSPPKTPAYPPYPGKGTSLWSDRSIGEPFCCFHSLRPALFDNVGSFQRRTSVCCIQFGLTNTFNLETIYVNLAYTCIYKPSSFCLRLWFNYKNHVISFQFV